MFLQHVNAVEQLLAPHVRVTVVKHKTVKALLLPHYYPRNGVLFRVHSVQFD